MGRDGARHELVAAGVGERLLAHRLGLGVRLKVARLRQGGQLRLGEAVDVRAVEARRRGRRHDNLAHAGIAARLDHHQRALVVHLEVEVARVERAHRRSIVPHAVRASDERRDGLRIANVADEVLDARVAPRIWRRGHDVEHAHRLRAAFDEHLHEAPADKAGAASDRAHGWNGRMATALGRFALKWREVR